MRTSWVLGAAATALLTVVANPSTADDVAIDENMTCEQIGMAMMPYAQQMRTAMGTMG